MGFMRLPNGDCYDGEFFNNMRHGKGIYRLANGASYEGDYMDGLEHGRGLRKWTNGNYFEGDFSEGRMTKGQMFLSDVNKKLAAEVPGI